MTATNHTSDEAPTALANLRDIGHAAPMLASNVLLRSDAPLPGDHHHEYSVSWPPQTVIDLRDPGEAAHEHPLQTVAEVHSLPVMSGSALEPQDMPPSLRHLYVSMLQVPSASWLVKAIHLIAHSPPPVLVHCTAGKDRTGVTVALALRIVGVPDDAIIADYVATEAFMDGVIARARKTRRRHLDPEALAAIPSAFIDAPAEAIQGFLAQLDAYERGTLGWYHAHGGTEDTVTALRDRLLARA